MITIIGAGVIGLAVAAELAGGRDPVYVLEKNDSFGLETSSRNSETIHAGIYYPTDTLKARTCVEGNALLYELCERHGIPYRKTGKLIAATNEAQLGALEDLLEKGRANGAPGLTILSRSEMARLEPNVVGVDALLCPSSGVVDSHALIRFFLNAARENGAQVVYRSRVVGIERLSNGYQVEVRDDTGASTFNTDVVVNCAGLSSDEVARLAGIDVDRAGYRLHYCKGEYFSVAGPKGRMVERLIYPVPRPGSGGMGIHTVFDVEGRMRLGPSARYVDEIDYAVDGSQQRAFFEGVRPFLPFIEYDDLAPEMAGIRPKLEGPGEGFRDFVIREESDRGLPGLINLIGIESPGLTGSPSIARHVAALVRDTG
jgi:L-2-hydroxyglutarate oxidase LhgO